MPDFAGAEKVDWTEIPIIDLSALSLDEQASKIINAATTVGFFYVKNHGIAQELIDQAFAASRGFFELPEEGKATISVNQNQRGWMAQGLSNLEGSKTHDAKEVFFWGWEVEAEDPDVLAGLPLVRPNLWPVDVAPSLKSDLLPYYNQVVALGDKLLAAIALGLGQQQDFFKSRYLKPLARGQLVYYPPSQKVDESEQRFGAAAHSDFGALTILMQDSLGGLQVQNLNGDWIEAPPIPGTFVCNIGDLLERWTNKRLVSTKHRVINRSNQARFSIPIFYDPSSGAVVDPRDMCTDDSEAIFPPITAGEHITGRNKRNFTHYKKES
jgi:isopenicillin N synthase-like dioxygenase